MEDEAVDVADNVEDTTAYVVLEAAMLTGKISEERFNELKAKVSAMHGAVAQIVANSRVLNHKAIKLENSAAAGQKRLGEVEAKQGEIEDAADNLRDDLEAAETAMVKEQEREVALEIEVNVLMSQKEDLEIARAELQREYEMSLAPIVTGLETSIDAIKEEREKLEKDMAHTKFEVESLGEEHAQREERLAATLASIKEVEEKLGVEKLRPDGVRKELTYLEEDKKSQLRALEAANMKAKELDKALADVSSAHKAAMVRYEQDSRPRAVPHGHRAEGGGQPGDQH